MTKLNKQRNRKSLFKTIQIILQVQVSVFYSLLFLCFLLFFFFGGCGISFSSSEETGGGTYGKSISLSSESTNSNNFFLLYTAVSELWSTQIYRSRDPPVGLLKKAPNDVNIGLNFFLISFGFCNTYRNMCSHIKQRYIEELNCSPSSINSSKNSDFDSTNCNILRSA